MTDAPPPASLLIGHVKAHIRQGEKAKERADIARNKAEDHFLAAGQYLRTLRTHYCRGWGEFENLLKTQIGISTGRANELMQLAGGQKTLQEIRDATAQRVRAHRASKDLFVTSQCNEDLPDDPPTPAPTKPALSNGGNAHQIIDALTASSSNSREAAAKMLISGPQHQYQTVTNAVADLYQTLAKAGR